MLGRFTGILIALLVVADVYKCDPTPLPKDITFVVGKCANGLSKPDPGLESSREAGNIGNSASVLICLIGLVPQYLYVVLQGRGDLLVLWRQPADVSRHGLGI